MEFLHRLPDEIIQQIFQYILPIFEYVKYIEHIKLYKNTQLNMALMCNNYINDMYSVSPEQLYNNISELSLCAELQKKCLKAIKQFRKKNVKFVRPAISNELNSDTYVRAFDYEVASSNIVRMEKNMYDRRGIWKYQYTKNEILIVHDINNILFNGSTQDLIYSCIINNVGNFKKQLLLSLNTNSISTDDIVNYINKKYVNLDACVGGGSFRKKLIRSLMKL